MKEIKGGTHAKEFKEFAMRGNVIDPAGAVIIGGAFSGAFFDIPADTFAVLPPRKPTR